MTASMALIDLKSNIGYIFSYHSSPDPMSITQLGLGTNKLTVPEVKHAKQ